MSCFTSIKFSSEHCTNSNIKIINSEIPVTGGSIEESRGVFWVVVVWGLAFFSGFVFNNTALC